MRRRGGERGLIAYWLGGFAVAGMLLAGLIATLAWATQRLAGSSPADVFADPADARAVDAGRRLYAAECAGCHGDDLKGQPGWQQADADGRVKAPPQDDTGHTFEHSDADLFRTVKHGVVTRLDRRVEVSKPAFQGRLDDGQIIAVLAFIKSRWPIGVRAAQATRNPDFRGMPDTDDWTFPGECRTLDGRRVAEP